jgi:hypothetical protein
MKMNDQEAVEFREIVYGWERNGVAKTIAENPLWKWEPGMKRDRNGHPALNDVVTIALIGAQARRLTENERIRDRGGYERVRNLYSYDKGWWNNFSPVHITPIASGWKIKGLDTEDVEHAVVAERVWQTEGYAWGIAWLLASHDAIVREGCIYNGEERDGLARCREIYGIEAHEGERPVPLFVTEV